MRLITFHGYCPRLNETNGPEAWRQKLDNPQRQEIEVVQGGPDQGEDAVAVAPQPRLHVRCGKGGKDRFVPLAPAMVAQLRAWWQMHQNRTWLFPSPGRGWAERAHSLSEAMQRATEPMSTSAVQMAFKLARAFERPVDDVFRFHAEG